MTPPFIDVYKRQELAGADYLGVGAVFQTSTKTDAKEISHAILKEICESVNIPVVAIGGIGKQNIEALAGSGIAGVALVSVVFAAEDIEPILIAQGEQQQPDGISGLLRVHPKRHAGRMVAVNKGPPITHKLVDQLLSHLPVFFIGVLFRLLMENRHQMCIRDRSQPTGAFPPVHQRPGSNRSRL